MSPIGLKLKCRFTGLRSFLDLVQSPGPLQLLEAVHIPCLMAPFLFSKVVLLFSDHLPTAR